ncbi:unnamed protein product [Oreochromis niloticus]|nr:unnamed protein product [Mustela putorius furo]
MDVTCKYWPYLERVTKSGPELQHLLSMKPFLSVFHAIAHDFKCEVKWSEAYQDGAGLTLGKEVEQCNAFLSRIAVTTKHMSKAGWRDMLTLMAMRWNQQKLDQLATSLTHQYQKATKALLTQLQNLESLKVQFAVADSQLDEWVSDLKEIRRKIREEKGILTSAVEKYNRMVPDKETLCLEEILSGDTAWP